MPLTDTAVRSVKPKDKTGGPYLEINPASGKWWRWKYRFAGEEKRLSFGVYPDVSLQLARDRRDSSRRQLAAGIDPGEVRKAERQAQAGAESFEAIAREWCAKFSQGWVPNHGDRILRRLEKGVFPWLGRRPIAEIEAPDLLAVLRRIEARGALETAHRALQNCGQVFRYAVATARAKRDPTGDLRGALPRPKEKHHASIIEPKRRRAPSRDRYYQGYFATKCALRLALVFVGRASYVEHSGRRSIWKKPNGAFPRSE